MPVVSEHGAELVLTLRAITRSPVACCGAGSWKRQGAASNQRCEWLIGLRKREAAGLLSASIEVRDDGKAMKFYRVAPFALHLTPTRRSCSRHGRR